MQKKFYLTTPLYYVNDVPHIGHAYTTIAADVLARWERLCGHSVFFLTGTDEHGAKIETAALKHEEKPQVYVDRIAEEFRKLWGVLNISFDDFIRTSDERHKAVVQEVFEKLKETGDIYRGVYEDWYCIHDESYFSESELKDRKCPSCGREVQKLKEDSYFFKLSNYENRLLEHFRENPDFLSPSNRANEIINFVKSGFNDLSVSRTRVKWGIPVRSDPGHVIYVWFDALLNYISAPQYNLQNPSASPFSSIWPANVHLVGKEIYRFHTVIWPAILMALKLPLPKKVFAHGWWTVDGQKMSKSIGNVVDPHKMCAEYGVDAFRYFLLREVPFGSDGDFSEKSLLGRYNAELANNLGNLFQRTVTILVKNFDGVIPKSSTPLELMNAMGDLISTIEKAYHQLAFFEILENIYGMMVKTNKFIDDRAPWTLGADRREELAHVLLECLTVIKHVAFFLYPFMPTKISELWNRLGEKETIEKVGPTLIESLKKRQGLSFADGQTVTKGEPLFMRKGGRWK